MPMETLIARTTHAVRSSRGRRPSCFCERLETRRLLSAYSAAVLADHPRLYLHLGESAGATVAANDPGASGGSALKGAYFNSPSLGQPGIPGTAGDHAVSLNGSNQYVGSIKDTLVYTSMTLEAWVKPATNAGQDILVNTDANGDANNAWSDNIRIVNINGVAHFSCYFYDGSAKGFVATGAVTVGTLYHVVATATNNGAIQLFVNGALQGGAYYLEGSVSSTPLKIGTLANYGFWEIGASAGSNGRDPFAQGYFKGTVDEVAIYPGVVSASRILTHSKTGGSGAVATGALSGTVFNDITGDGKQGGGEPSLSGWTVFLDTNHNGKPDSGELSTTTSAKGVYSFAALAPGSYQVTEVPKAGWLPVLPKKVFADVTVSAGATTTQNFADARPVSISGAVFIDTNANGFQDPTESGAAGWTVYLDTNNNGALNSGEISFKTTSSGQFSFTGLLPGLYVVRLLPTSGYSITNMASYNINLGGGISLSGLAFGVLK